MGIVSKIVTTIAKKHATRLGTLVDRQADPRLFNAVMDRVDKKLSLFCSNFDMSMNPEMEVLQDALFDGMKLGYFDDIIDLFKYGNWAIKGAKFKVGKYLSDYRQALDANLPPLWGRGFVFDFRKGPVTEEDIAKAVKKIFMSNDPIQRRRY